MNVNKTVALFLTVCVSTTVFAADWPHWRGPNYDGISTETDWNPKALETPVIVWKAEIGTGFSAVSVADGKAYAMGNVDKETDVIYCFDALTGEEKWRHEYAEPLNPKYYEGGCSATPTIHEKKVYTLSKQGKVFCLNAETGEVVWDKTLPFEPPTWGFASSVLILEEMAICNAGSSGIALNKMTGDIIWQSENKPSGYATPVPYQQDEKACVCIFGEKTVMGVEAKTGNVLWSYPWETKYGVNAADPIISGNEVFITSGYKQGAALLRFEGSTVEKVWENKNMCSQMSGPVLIDGYLYGIDDKQLVCVVWKTGEQKWSEKAPGKGALCAAGDKLIVIGDKGKLFIVQAVPDEYRELSSAQVLENLCWTMPVLAKGHVYVRDSKKGVLNNLICVDVRQNKTQ